MQLGPIAEWGLNIDKKTVAVDTEKFETNQKGYLCGWRYLYLSW